MQNLYLNVKYKIALSEKLKIKPFVTSLLFWISNLTVRKALEKLKIVKIVIYKGSVLSNKVKIVFSDNPSQNVETNLCNQVKNNFYGKFNKWFCSILLHYCQFLFLEWRLGTRLSMLNFEIFLKFLPCDEQKLC